MKSAEVLGGVLGSLEQFRPATVDADGQILYMEILQKINILNI